MSEPQTPPGTTTPEMGVDGTSAEGEWASDEYESSPGQTLPAPDKGPEGLKLVSLAPAGSIPDVENEAIPLTKHDPYIGCIVDQRYKVEKVLGEGGMGVVYQCRHTIIGKLVAMKVLRADLARDSEVTERFLNEAKSASGIGNPHIIDISDFGRLPDGSTYFIMEFLDGVPLSSAFSEGQPTPIARLLNIARQLAEGLSAAHNANIVHRDLKPDNIFLLTRGKQKDFVKILDFGIAKVSSAGQGKLTRAGTVFGTPHYMSPEQAAGAPVDHRGDIYSFGVILYEMASGKVPFDADNFMGILTQHMYKSPVPIRALVPQPQDVPPGLEAIILKCLSKRPEQRYNSMDELVEEFDRVRDGLVPEAVPEMMSRSGGFNVPGDYLMTKGEMPAPMPATPSGHLRKTSGPLYVGIALVCAAIGIVIAMYAKNGSRVASTPSEAKASPLHAQPALAMPSSTPEPASANSSEAPPTPAVRQVLLAVDPLEAHVFEGEHDLGTSPVSISVTEGHPKTVRAERPGFATKELVLDGSIAKASLKLERVKAARPAPKPAAPPAKAAKKKPSIGGGEIVNPWD
ncbi:MAG: serine/threonine-protein kinase [Polyangiaceae bacterium]|nr:serine/threonine-protein kinase [Polyangiaceae bacterium]